MFKAFLAVLEDLVEFVLAGFELKKQTASTNSATVKDDQAIALPPKKTKYTPLLNGQTAYVSAEKAFGRSRPVVAFDTMVGALYYGEKVSVLSNEGKFLHIDSKLGEVWLKQDELIYNPNEILPHFIHQTFYFSDTTETKKLRKYLRDECGGGELHFTLQSVEFILYCLRQSGVTVDWGKVRPRLPGTWQKILKGKSGIHIGVVPKTNSVMEYFTDAGAGKLTMVGAVHPDNSIAIKSIGKNSEGEYLEESLTAEEWHELRPVFISFT